MKLLFDANLSPRLTALLRDAFPDSEHVFSLGLVADDDMSIWSYARDNGFIVVSKDSDFHGMSFVLGAPPKVIWLRVGNCPTALIENILTTRKSEIELFVASDEATFLIVEP